MYYILMSIMILLLVISLIFRKKYILLSEIYIFIFIVAFIFIIGLRYGVGRDYFEYEYIFDMGFYDLEPIYATLSYMIKNNFKEFHYLTILMSLITNMLIYISLKERKIKNYYLALSILIYISDVAFIYANIMRQGVAIAIFFYSSKYIKKRDIKRYVLCILIGAGFHKSILFMIPAYWLYKFELTYMNYVILIIFSYILVGTGMAQNLLNILSKYTVYIGYINSDFIINQDVNLLSIGVLLKAILSMILLKYYNLKKSNNKLDIAFYQIGVIVNILSISTFIFDRIGVYFSLFSISAIPEIIKDSKSNTRKILLFIVIIVFLSLYTKSLIISPDDAMLQYKSIFSK